MFWHIQLFSDTLGSTWRYYVDKFVCFKEQVVQSKRVFLYSGLLRLKKKALYYIMQKMGHLIHTFLQNMKHSSIYIIFIKKSSESKVSASLVHFKYIVCFAYHSNVTGCQWFLNINKRRNNILKVSMCVMLNNS